MNENNLDKPVVSGFGDEWTRFDQSKLSFEEGNKCLIIISPYFEKNQFQIGRV